MPPVSAAVKAQVVAVLTGLYSQEVLTSYGTPGTFQPDAIVAAGDIRTVYSRPVSAATRPREQVSELDVTFSVYAEGDETVQQPATETAYALLGTFADYFKTKPNETLNGTCREAWVSRDELTETVAVDPATEQPVGRVSTIVAVLEFKARV